MKYKINQTSNIYDLNTIVKEHYHLNDLEFEKLQTSVLSNPKNLTNIESCLNILRDILVKKEKILIVGDYDCDGICATAILCRAFSRVGLDYGFYIPNRLTEGYGLNVSILQKAIDKGYKNVITVDNGVKALDAMKFASDNNIRLIITDHHTYEREDIKCDCFLHPFLNDDEFVNCSGAGIALQIARCMIPNDKEIVCYAALAAIADCMNVTRENRNIIKKGIQYLNEGCCPSLHALKNKPQDTFNMKMMSFSIIPKINAMGRLCDCVNVNNAVRYLLLDDLNAIYNSATQINQVNELRKEKTSEMDKIAQEIIQGNDFEIISHKDFHEGIVGLLASKLSNQYQKPFIVLSEDETKYKGSIRSIEGLNLINYFKDFNSFDKFGGHSQAAGITISKDKINELIEYVNNHDIILDELDNYILCEQVHEQALKLKDVQKYLSLEPFGNGFEEINFYIENIQIQNSNKLSNGKYTKIQSTNNITYLFFKQDLQDKIKNNINIIGKLSINEFRGNYDVNIIVDDIVEVNYE